MYYTHRTAYALNSVHIQKGETREVYVFMLCLHGDSFACVRVSVLTRMNGIVSCAEEQYSVVQYAPLYVGSWVLPKCCSQRATIVHLYDTQYNPIHGFSQAFPNTTFCTLPSNSLPNSFLFNLSPAFSFPFRFGLRILPSVASKVKQRCRWRENERIPNKCAEQCSNEKPIHTTIGLQLKCWKFIAGDVNHFATNKIELGKRKEWEAKEAPNYAQQLVTGKS